MNQIGDSSQLSISAFWWRNGRGRYSTIKFYYFASWIDSSHSTNGKIPV